MNHFDLAIALGMDDDIGRAILIVVTMILILVTITILFDSKK
jgi:hypothetical protein